MTLSTAYSKFRLSTVFSFMRAACRAASLQMLAMSAPVKREKLKRLIANMGSDHSTATRHTADAILQDLGEGRSYLPENPPRDLHMH